MVARFKSSAVTRPRRHSGMENFLREIFFSVNSWILTDCGRRRINLSRSSRWRREDRDRS